MELVDGKYSKYYLVPGAVVPLPCPPPALHVLIVIGCWVKYTVNVSAEEIDPASMSFG